MSETATGSTLITLGDKVMKNIIGLTGPTGSGKSTLKNVAENLGAAFIDCDKVVHEIFETDKDCVAAIENAFGSETVENGRINRKVLGSKAFSSKENTALLNQTVFPFVTYRILKIIEETNEQTVILDAPTLFESGIDEICGATVAVLANKQTRRQRIIDRDNLSEETADLRLSAQQSEEFFKAKAERIFYNNTDIKALENEFENFLKGFMGGK